jgi:hypothetical protein
MLFLHGKDNVNACQKKYKKTKYFARNNSESNGVFFVILNLGVDSIGLWRIYSIFT